MMDVACNAIDSNKEAQDLMVSEKVEPDQKSTDCNSKDDDTQTQDQYAYLKRNAFTSEIFKIEVHDLPKYIQFGMFKKKLSALGLNPIKCKVLGEKTSPHGYATFASEEERTRAVSILSDLQWKGRTLRVKKAGAKPDPYQKRRKIYESEEGEARKNVIDDGLTPSERLRNQTEPWWNVPYEEQLQRKDEQMKSVLHKVCRAIFRNNNDFSRIDWLDKARKNNDKMVCPYESIKPSPRRTNYRNKCEFTIGKSSEGKAPVIGFRHGKYREGTCSVENPIANDCNPQRAMDFIQMFQTFLENSKWPYFDPVTKEGHWRILTVRTSEKQDILVIVEFHPQNLEKEELIEVRKSLFDFFTTGDGKDFGLTSLYLRVKSDIRSENDAPLERIMGQEHLQEDLLGLKFNISPSAFFQVNTKAAEVLYTLIGDWCNLTSETILLDVCCGTGTIGLTLANKVNNVIGVEMCEEAVQDAKANALLNDIKNVETYCSKAEDIMNTIVDKLPKRQDVVAIVDPPRAGLHTRVIQAIRRCEQISRVIYVSCNPNAAINNFEELVRKPSRKIKGTQFIPIKATSVDLFPNTEHCELVVIFERLKEENYSHDTSQDFSTTKKTDTDTNTNTESESVNKSNQ